MGFGYPLRDRYDDCLHFNFESSPVNPMHLLLLIKDLCTLLGRVTRIEGHAFLDDLQQCGKRFHSR